MKVYQIEGSEDGTIDICTSHKRALQIATNYVKNVHGESGVVEIEVVAHITYVEGDSATATITRWFTT